MSAYAFRISALDRAFLAGFLEGEACFRISELNGGQSYSCGVTTSVRDDDQDLLEWLVALTGIGRLRRIAAIGGSRPQIGWSINTQDDCATLARLLANGFHGRRSSELDIWMAAVTAWMTSGGGERRATLAGAKQRLHHAKRYGGGSPTARPLAAATDQQAGYISGLVCAEGCFQFTGGRPRFGMHLRHDDRPLLELLQTVTGYGAVYDHRPPEPLNPSSSWIIAAREHLERFAAMLYAVDLPGRKGAELSVWEVAVSEFATANRLGVRPRKRIVQLASQRLRGERRYRPSGRALLELARRDVHSECLSALAAWAAHVEGSLSCVEYARWRRDHADCPTRNTVAKEFGSWHAALEAAGLSARVARKPRPAGGEVRRRRQRAVQRGRVLEALRRFEAEQGRRPRAMEFFRWRAVACPDSPTQATVYNLFPGGWKAVLRGLDEDGDAV